MGNRKHNKSLKAETKPSYTYWQALVLSFVRSGLYWDVYKRWTGIGLLYLLLMISLFSIPYGIKAIIEMNQFFSEQIIAPFLRLPDIPYVDGKVKFDKKMPYYIKNKKGEIEAIIDNTGTVSKFDTVNYPGLRFLFIDRHVYFTMPGASDYFSSFRNAAIPKDNVPKVTDIKLSKDISFVFNGSSVLKDFQIATLKKVSLTAVYPVVVLSFYPVAVVLLLPLAMMGQIVSKAIFKVQLYFKQSCRLLCVAFTPAFFVLQIMAAGEYYERYIGFVWLGFLSMYFSFALIMIKRNLRSIARI